MTVANVSSPANFFHLLRRQLARPFRKPLIHMSPKSLLRHPECVSDISELAEGNRFREVLDDMDMKDGKKAKRLLLCTGKVYYDLLAYKRDNERDDVAIVRIEQLYPLPGEQLKEIFKKYPKASTLWIQEEPSNMGAWQYMNSIFLNEEIGLKKELKLVARKSSASPATGFMKVHKEQQERIVREAFEG